MTNSWEAGGERHPDRQNRSRPVSFQRAGGCRPQWRPDRRLRCPGRSDYARKLQFRLGRPRQRPRTARRLRRAVRYRPSRENRRSDRDLRREHGSALVGRRRHRRRRRKAPRHAQRRQCAECKRFRGRVARSDSKTHHILGAFGVPMLWAHPRWIGGAPERIVTRRAVWKGPIGPASHAPIHELPALCAFHVDIQPRRKFNALIVLVRLRPGLRKTLSWGHQAHRNDGGGSDDDAHDFFLLSRAGIPRENDAIAR